MESTAANSLQSVTPTQLQELHGVLKNTISGRQVMIPLTSKAFVLGALRPPKNSNDEEIVLVRKEAGADLKEMRRRTVCEFLIEEKQRKKDQGKRKKGKLESLQEETKAPKVATSSATSANAVPSLPYFEIKEELDGAGKVVRSEAVNVTKQLELVTNHVNGSDGESKAPEETKEEDNLDQSDFDVETYTYDDDTKTKVVTDQEYKALSDRLEELARLEEEAEAESTNNALSALKLQSKGWSKGFLGGGRKSTTTPKSTPTRSSRTNPKVQTSHKAPPLQQSPTEEKVASEPPQPVSKPEPKSVNPINSKPKATKQAGGWSKGFLNIKSAAKTNINTKQPKAFPPTREQPNEQSSKKVSFQSKMEEVREIPRIGQTSVSTLEKPPPPPTTTTTTTTGPSPARTFDRSVFSGVVKERPIGQHQSSKADKPRTRVSKFAQERLEMENR